MKNQRKIKELLELLQFSFMDQEEESGLCYAIDQMSKNKAITDKEARSLINYLHKNRPFISRLRWLWYDFYDRRAHWWWNVKNKKRRIRWLDKHMAACQSLY